MNRRFKYGKIWLVAATAIWATCIRAQQPPTGTRVHQQRVPQFHSLSIQEAVAYAEKNNVQVKNALLDYRLQEETNRNITSAAYPQLTGSLGSNYNPKVAVQSFPNFISMATYGVLTQEGVKNGSGQPIQMPSDFGYITAAFGTRWNATGSISLSQILFDGQVFVGLQARRTSLEYAHSNVEVTKESIKVNVYKVYYQLVVSQTQMQQIDANIERSDKLLNDTRALFKNGFAENLDVDRISVQLANLLTQKLTTQRNIDNGYFGLKFLLGMPVTDSVLLTTKITEDQIRDSAPLDSSYQYTDRKEFQALTAANQLNEYNIKRYKSSFLPTANLNSTYSKEAFRGQFDFFGKGDWYSIWTVGLTINVPIFDGFARASNLAKAKIQQQQTQNQLENLKNSIDNDVQQAQNTYTAAMSTLVSQRQNMDLASAVYDQSKKKYEAGLGSTSDITTAQTDLVTAQTNYVRAMYDAIQAKIDYFTAIGKLP